MKLSNDDTLLVMAIVLGGALLAGLLVWFARSSLSKRGPTDSVDTSFIRSWLAVALVFGLLAMTAASFALKDTSIRSALIGGLVANTGAAVAFYFSSKASDAARADILTTAVTLAHGTAKPSTFTHDSPPAATVGAQFNYVFAADGRPAPTYKVTSGSVPSGLTFDESTGQLAGEPTAVDTFTFVLTARNAAGYLDSGPITIAVAT